MKSLLAEVSLDEAFLSLPLSPPRTPEYEIVHLRRQIEAQSEVALLLVKSLGLEVPYGHGAGTTAT